MMTDEKHPGRGAFENPRGRALRQRAEALAFDQAAAHRPDLAAPSSTRIQQMLHELQVHQIELEMQNDELCRTEAELEEARARYFELYNLAPAGLCTIDHYGRIQEANLTAANLLGVHRIALIGKAFTRFTAREDQDAFYLLCRQLLNSGQQQSRALRMLRSHGEPFWVHVVVKEGKQKGEIQTLFSDITAQKQAELERTQLEQQATELRTAQRAAEVANLAKSAFLATVSHEMRTPLNSIIGFLSLLLDSPLSDEQRRQAELACSSGEMLLQLVNDFLDYSKIESGRLELDVLTFSPRQELEKVLDMMQLEAGQKGLQLNGRIEAPGLVRGDAARLRQIVLNLLSNAVKFTAHGQVTLGCQENHRREGVIWLGIEVADTGIGIKPEVQERLFQPFVQADASTTRQFGGTGLGLAISKRLTEAMGGTIRLSSTPGVGTTVRVELPLAIADAEAIPPAEAAAAPQEHHADAALRGRVLVVEDNHTNQIMAKAMLKRIGCEVDIAENGLVAVNALSSNHYDLVLMDCDMPVMDGTEATRMVRARETVGQHVIIIAMTASAMQGDMEKCLEAGMDDFLPKPFHLQDLRQKVGIWLTGLHQR